MTDKVAKTLRGIGFNVIRLDKRSYPDLILTQSEEPIAIEIQTSDVLHKLNHLSKYSAFKKTLVITLDKHKLNDKHWITYILTLALNKRGYTHKNIQTILKKELNESIDDSLLIYWLEYGVKPFGNLTSLITLKAIEILKDYPNIHY